MCSETEVMPDALIGKKSKQKKEVYFVPNVVVPRCNNKEYMQRRKSVVSYKSPKRSELRVTKAYHLYPQFHFCVVQVGREADNLPSKFSCQFQHQKFCTLEQPWSASADSLFQC